MTGKKARGGNSQSVYLATKEETSWLCFVIATGDAPGEGVMYASTAGEVVAAAGEGVLVACTGRPTCLRATTSSAACLCCFTNRASTQRTIEEVKRVMNERVNPMLAVERFPGVDG